MKQAKQLYWNSLTELSLFKLHFFNSLPGKIGISVRRKFYKRRIATFGINFTTESNVRIQSPQNLHIGSHVHIACDSYLNASGEIKIGNNVYIGPGTKIWTDNHIFQDPSIPFTKQGFEYKPVVIENDVWIGPRVFIKPGIIIMTGSIIKAGTVLAKSVPPFAILEGNPGKIVGWRKPPIRESLY